MQCFSSTSRWSKGPAEGSQSSAAIKRSKRGIEASIARGGSHADELVLDERKRWQNDWHSFVLLAG
ncbi:hypothetical protein EYF80_001351 [Liparis tanakae]|uniref:Uncharacterized protein n=1 Tax=Liparis tanakae TaxID=230148 RepID=A0A4Z2JG15_9TELE|nr:hypothetical protein EYF80_001351 [Liparis tanakae]